MFYPNPSNGTFSVRLSEGHQFDNLMIMNHLGQVVHRQDLSESDATVAVTPENKLTSGIYYLKLNGGENAITEKLILY